MLEKKKLHKIICHFNCLLSLLNNSTLLSTGRHEKKKEIKEGKDEMNTVTFSSEYFIHSTTPCTEACKNLKTCERLRSMTRLLHIAACEGLILTARDLVMPCG